MYSFWVLFEMLVVSMAFELANTLVNVYKQRISRLHCKMRYSSIERNILVKLKY